MYLSTTIIKDNKKGEKMEQTDEINKNPEIEEEII